MTPFEQVLQKYRETSVSEKHKGYRFEKLMQSFLKTYPLYEGKFSSIWLWNEFPSRTDFGVGDKDLGIDLVAHTKDGEYWAVQCKCYQEDAFIDKPKVDTFLSTSGKSFNDTLEFGKKVNFAYRLWIDTTKKGFNAEAEATIHNQTPQVGRLGYYDLDGAAVDWLKLDEGKKAVVKKYDIKNHQQTAISEVHNYLKNNDRGKLIMACGTGKTFTSLRIAEKETGENGLVLFLVPSIALLGQTLREWKNQCVKPIHAICICSDTGVSKSASAKDIDYLQATVTDLALPASTNTKNITRQFEAARFAQKSEGGNIVVFSTYQSIDVISDVQKKINLQRKDSFLFDLVICDEAHRTTGVTLSGIDETAFVKVHEDRYIKAKKRIYMTATPRIYTEAAQKKAKEAFATVCSMDDTKTYGEEMYRIGFGEAVDKELLSDYKVIVLTIEEDQLNEKLQKSIAEKDAEINTEDALKIIGCINALSKKSLTDKELFEGVDPAPMRSAVAFCQNIAISKATALSFNICREAYFSTMSEAQREEIVKVSADHVDGTMGAQTRERKLHWLKSANAAQRECNILHNVRCLSEGVDVPSLDAVMFLSARNSQIDVVQSVGRVMRKADDKKYGYIIIPVVVLPEADPEKVLSSDRFKVVWTVLNALRAHDDRFDATINKIELNRKIPDKIQVITTNIGGTDGFNDETTGRGQSVNRAFERQLELEFARLQGQIYAKIVQKCGTKPYWEQWAKDVAKIAEKHIESISAIVSKEGKAKIEFERYISGLRKNINPSVSEEDAIEMLAQHIITQPVFEALFEDYSFVKNNAVSKSLQGIIAALDEQTQKEDTRKLENFYISVKKRAEDIDNSEAKQKIIVELYDKFFRTAFPKVTERLGIVYTPVEIVDFIIHSVEDILQKEFGRSMSDENVHILDPFTGTGTFITRLLQSGIINDKDLKRKYDKEIHANEIVLLAYYIASINIENVYHDILKNEKLGIENIEFNYNEVLDDGYSEAAERNPQYFQKTISTKTSYNSSLLIPHSSLSYTPFPGICLTDTFQLGETADGENLFSEIFPQNSERVQEQQKTPLRIIIGNPPYSIGQKSANDASQNQQYPKLEARIAETYAFCVSATTVKSLYDTYVKAFRWSTDRLDHINGGIICFVSNASWLDSNGFSGFRFHLEEEFSSIHVFNLRGNQRTSGELSRREGGKIFGSGSRTPISITLLVKKPKQKNTKAIIHYYDIGDYHSREKKLDIIKDLSSISNVNWTLLFPNNNNDWINQRNDVFTSLIPIEPDIKYNTSCNSFYNLFSLGINTARDAWVFNSSLDILLKNMKNHVSFYNNQVNGFRDLIKKFPKYDIEKFRDNSPDKISWSSSLIDNLKRLKNAKYEKDRFCVAIYRPFYKQYLYLGDKMIHRKGQMEEFFPNTKCFNLLICIHGIGGNKGFSTLMTNYITDLNVLEASARCFPLYWYEKKELTQGGLFEQVEDEYIRHDAISDFILDQAKSRYGNTVTKETIFYYVYGLLHSPDYRKAFANDLKKMLPRLPLVEKVADFWAFSDAGRKLANLHLNYEHQPPPKSVLINGKPMPKILFPENKLVVNQMKFPAKGQKDTIYYNSFLTISNIPAKAYEYIVNGKYAIDWIMERYAVTIHKESGIRNDPNDWAREHNNQQYILDLLLSIITVSIETVDIVAELPKVECG